MIDVSNVPLLLQKAIVAKLRGSASLVALLSGGTDGVLDFIPDDKDYPFVQVGEADLGDWGSHDSDGYEVESQINVWHQKSPRGRAPVWEILEHVRRALHDTTFAIPNVTTVVSRFQTATVLVDPDAVTYHGVIRFRIVLGGNNA